jgi:hypothetical protein
MFATLFDHLKFNTMKKTTLLLRTKYIILGLVLGGFLFSELTAEAANPKKRGRAYHRRIRHGNAEGVILYGPIAGANRTMIDGDNTLNNDYKFGYHVGLMGDFGVAPTIMVEPQLLFSNKGSQGLTNSSLKLNMNYVEFRAHGKLLLNRNVSLIAGPYAAMLLSANFTFEGENFDVKDNFSPFDFGINVGASYEFKNGFGASAQYCLGLADINNAQTNGLETPAITNAGMQVSLFYLIGK